MFTSFSFQIRSPNIIGFRVTQFNNLIDLEAEYGRCGHAIVEAYEKSTKANRELSQYMHQKLEDHDRNSLVKKMPKRLTSRPLHDILQRGQSGRKA